MKSFNTKSQTRTGHTREPDPTHNELKHTTTRKTAARERTPQTNLTFTRTHTPPEENDANQQTTPPRITATLTQPPPRASALASGTIACASSRCSTDPSASLAQRLRPLPHLSLHLPLPPNLVKQEAGEARELRLTVSVPRHLLQTAMTTSIRTGMGEWLVRQFL